MASYDTTSHSNFPIPYKTIAEANTHLIEKIPEEYDALIATLPLQPFIPRPLSFTPLRSHKGAWIPEFILRGALEMQQRFKPRPSDLLLASSPKSGTTWLKAMIFATLSRTNYSLDQHPFHTHNPHQCVAFMESEFAHGRGQILEAIASPRMMSTHLPVLLMPESILDSDCRIVYVWRDPKDVLVSLWYFVQKILGGADKVATFDQFYEFFCQGVNSFGPIWDHVLGYWEESKRRPGKILFLKYEHILQEPIKHAKDLAHFIGCPYSEAEESQGVVDQIVELCSFKKLKNLYVNKGEDIGNVHVSHEYFFRNGKAGDWRGHMTKEMGERLDAIIGQKFKGSGFVI